MCVLIFFLNPSETSAKGYKLILINIRDEFFTRPTAPAQEWSKDPMMVGGMDMEPGREGGAWLVFNKNGRFASLLNVLEKDSMIQKGKKGRGFLAVNFAKTGNDVPPRDYVQALFDERSEFNGFTVVCVDLKKSSGAFMCNTSDLSVQDIGEGYHAFGNSVLPRQWPKVSMGKKLFEEIVEKNKNEEKSLENGLFDLMNNSTNYGVDESMRRQSDEPQEVLNLRGALKFYIPEFDYGSRTQTLVLIRGDNSALYVEKTVENGKWVERRTEFHLKD